jgi:tRNA(Ile)-lysidine synthase
VKLPVPGSVRFGDWLVHARPAAAGRPGIDAAMLAFGATVRGWRPGDRMRPAGLGGTKTLQDLFTDRKIPREERATVPLVESGGEIAWVAGVAVGERFTAHGEPAVELSARRF